MKSPCIGDHGGASFTLNCDEALQQGQGLEHRTKNTVTLKGKGAEIRKAPRAVNFGIKLKKNKTKHDLGNFQARRSTSWEKN